jgi:hypothetical protein
VRNGVRTACALTSLCSTDGDHVWVDADMDTGTGTGSDSSSESSDDGSVDLHDVGADAPAEFASCFSGFESVLRHEPTLQEVGDAESSLSSEPFGGASRKQELLTSKPAVSSAQELLLAKALSFRTVQLSGYNLC